MPRTPEDILSDYCNAIEPWFPIISTAGLRSRLSLTWNDAHLDVALLCLSITLLTTSPSSATEDNIDPSEFESMYFSTKSSLGSTEGLGINSFLVVQTRILVTLFEIAHGFYPAAYISIGATVRATDALEMHPVAHNLPSYYLDADARREEIVLIWCGILILDRHVAIESGPHASITHSRYVFFQELLKPTLCPAFHRDQDLTRTISHFARIVHASSLLEKIHVALSSPTSQHEFNMEELILTVQTLFNFETILKEEAGTMNHLYVTGLCLSKTALLLAFEDGSKVPIIAGVSKDCSSLATKSLVCLLSDISSTVEPFTLGEQSIDFNLLPIFVPFLVFKAAAIVTQRLLRGINSNEELKRLRILRTFLVLVGNRWLSCKRYLKLLNEDTTPRILNAMEQG